MPLDHSGVGKGKKGKPTGPYSKYKPKKAYTNKAFKKAVQAVVSANAETKQAFHAVQSENFNSIISQTGDAKRIIPSIAQGTGDYQRIGDQLRAQTLTVKGAIVYNPSTGQYGTYANSRIACRLMIVSPRLYPNIDDAQTNAAVWMNYLLKRGGTTSAFTGALSDLWAPINSDGIIKYYDKVFYLDAPYQVTAVGTNLMGKSTRFFSHSIKLRNKVIKYDSSVSGGIQPSNYGPVMILGYTHMDGSSADSLTTAVQLSYDTIFNYEDA